MNIEPGAWALNAAMSPTTQWDTKLDNEGNVIRDFAQTQDGQPLIEFETLDSFDGKKVEHTKYYNKNEVPEYDVYNFYDADSDKLLSSETIKWQEGQMEPAEMKTYDFYNNGKVKTVKEITPDREVLNSYTKTYDSYGNVYQISYDNDGDGEIDKVDTYDKHGNHVKPESTPKSLFEQTKELIKNLFE